MEKSKRGFKRDWAIDEEKARQNFSVNMVIVKLKILNDIVDKYYYPNRSMLINRCVDIALPTILEECKEMEKTRKKLNDLPEILGLFKNHGFVIRQGKQPKIRVPLGNIHFNSNNDKELAKASK